MTILYLHCYQEYESFFIDALSSKEAIKTLFLITFSGTDQEHRD